MFKRIIAAFICVTFSLGNLQYVHAQPASPSSGDFSINQLPVPGTMVGKSAPFAPLALKGLVVNLQKPLEFQFIVDTGNAFAKNMSSPNVSVGDLKHQANQLVKYFLAGLTIPEGDLWVNLSPYEKNRMVPEALGQTDLGRDLLAQDYILKQLTASLIYPEKDLGKEFWSKVYSKAQQQFGTTNVPVNTFNKVWILPDQAQVFENLNAAYVTKATLKVMLDEDYLALQKHSPLFYKEGSGEFRGSPKNIHNLASNIVRTIILPEIEKEVNTGKNFAPLRQIYQTLILAKWYKQTIQNGLLEALYTNKNKVAGVNLNDPAVKEQIYERYLKAYKKGAFNYIKEDPTPDGQVVPRKYFSGGTEMAMIVRTDGSKAMISHDGAMATFIVALVAAGASVGARALLEGLKRKRANKILFSDEFIKDNAEWLSGMDRREKLSECIYFLYFQSGAEIYDLSKRKDLVMSFHPELDVDEALLRLVLKFIADKLNLQLNVGHGSFALYIKGNVAVRLFKENKQTILIQINEFLSELMDKIDRASIAPAGSIEYNLPIKQDAAMTNAIQSMHGTNSPTLRLSEFRPLLNNIRSFNDPLLTPERLWGLVNHIGRMHDSKRIRNTGDWEQQLDKRYYHMYTSSPWERQVLDMIRGKVASHYRGYQYDPKNSYYIFKDSTSFYFVSPVALLGFFAELMGKDIVNARRLFLYINRYQHRMLSSEELIAAGLESIRKANGGIEHPEFSAEDLDGLYVAMLRSQHDFNVYSSREAYNRFGDNFYFTHYRRQQDYVHLCELDDRRANSTSREDFIEFFANALIKDREKAEELYYSLKTQLAEASGPRIKVVQSRKQEKLELTFTNRKPDFSSSVFDFLNLLSGKLDNKRTRYERIMQWKKAHTISMQDFVLGNPDHYTLGQIDYFRRRAYDNLLTILKGMYGQDFPSNPAMSTSKQDAAAMPVNGGIDLNQINVNRNGKTVNVQFDPAQLTQLEQGGFEGFTPVITGFQYIKSPFALLGINAPTK